MSDLLQHVGTMRENMGMSSGNTAYCSSTGSNVGTIFGFLDFFIFNSENIVVLHYLNLAIIVAIVFYFCFVLCFNLFLFSGYFDSLGMQDIYSLFIVQ